MVKIMRPSARSQQLSGSCNAVPANKAPSIKDRARKAQLIMSVLVVTRSRVLKFEREAMSKSSFPFDRSWRLGRYVINDAIYALYFIHDAR